MTLQIVMFGHRKCAGSNLHFIGSCQLYIHVYISTLQSIAAATCIKANISYKEIGFFFFVLAERVV